MPARHYITYPQGGPLSILNMFGGNLAAGGSAQFSYENLRIFKNVAREGRGFVTVGTPWTAQVALDANGWPTAAHTLVLWEGSATPGWASAATITTPFKCGFIGTGTPTAFQFGTVANIVNGNGTTTYTTFDYYGVSGGGWGFQNSAAAKNIFAYMPAYPGSVIDDVTQAAAYTPEALGIWGNVALLRFMWASNVVDNITLSTSSTRRTASNTQAYQTWSGGGTEGFPIEWGAYLAKYAGIGLWICLPVWEDGTNNAAGTYTTAALNLLNSVVVPTGKPIRIEIGNELWNGAYPAGISGTTGTLQTLAVSNGFATSPTDFNGVYQYLAYKYHQLASACRSVFGANFGVGKQVQIVMCNQLGGNGWETNFPAMLNYMNTNFGAPSADVQNLGLAPYMNLSNNAGDTTPTLVLADLAAQALITPYTFQCEHTSILAQHWGMNLCMYEGQWQVNVEATNANIPTVLASALLTPILETWAKTCIDAGFKFPLNWFEIGCSTSNSGNTPQDELSNVWATLVTTGSPQLAAIQAMATGAYAPLRNVIANSGDSISGGNFADLQSGSPYNLQVFLDLLPSFTYSCAPAQFYCPTAQTRSLVVNITGSGTANVELNGVMVFTGVSLSAGANTVGSVTLKKGTNYIAVGVNSFPGITTVNSVTFN